jgi:hypothetical protein
MSDTKATRKHARLATARVGSGNVGAPAATTAGLPSGTWMLSIPQEIPDLVEYVNRQTSISRLSESEIEPSEQN